MGEKRPCTVGFGAVTEHPFSPHLRFAHFSSSDRHITPSHRPHLGDTDPLRHAVLLNEATAFFISSPRPRAPYGFFGLRQTLTLPAAHTQCLRRCNAPAPGRPFSFMTSSWNTAMLCDSSRHDDIRRSRMSSCRSGAAELPPTSMTSTAVAGDPAPPRRSDVVQRVVKHRPGHVGTQAAHLRRAPSDPFA